MENLGYSRIIALIKEGTQIKIMNQLMNKNNLSSIWLRWGGNGPRSILIGGIYREHTLLGQEDPSISSSPPEQKKRWLDLIAQWRTAGRMGQCITIGDLNLDIMKWHMPDQSVADMTEITKNEIETENFVQLIDQPTRFWVNQDDSLIDHIWVNNPHKVLSKKNIRRSTADHNLIQIIYRTKGKLCNSNEIMKRNKKNFDAEKYREEINKINWSELYHFADIDLAYSFFEEKILSIYNKMAPMGKVQPRKRNSNWLSKDTRTKMVLRDSSHKKATISKNVDDWNYYKNLKNQCSKDIKNDRKNHFSKMNSIFQENNDSKGLFNLAKNRTGMKKSGKPSFFTIDGNIITSPKKLADIQANFFQSKIKKLKEKIPPNKIEPLFYLREALKRWGTTASSRPVFKFKKITELETLTLLKNLGNSTTFGYEKLDSSCLKIAALALHKPLCFLINLSLESENFSMKWKISKIIPLLKGKDNPPDNPSSYRPISIVPVCSKLVEMTAALQIKNFMKISNQWNSSNQAYREHGSTTTTLLQITDAIFKACDENNISTVITIDESAAFDCVDFETLDKKLQLYNFSTSARNWVQSYLKFRTYYVNIGSADSAMKPTDIRSSTRYRARSDNLRHLHQ